MDEPTSPGRDEAMGRLAEMVLDHLGIPRAGTSKHVQQLQDHLLPTFIDAARLSWLAASLVPPQTGTLPNEPSHVVYRYLHAATESRPPEIGTLNNILEELGVHALLDDVASSPDVAMLGSMPVDPYEERLLRASGHPNPGQAGMECLRRAAENPGVLSSSEGNLEEAAKACRGPQGPHGHHQCQSAAGATSSQPFRSLRSAGSRASTRPKAEASENILRPWETVLRVGPACWELHRNPDGHDRIADSASGPRFFGYRNSGGWRWRRTVPT